MANDQEGEARRGKRLPQVIAAVAANLGAMGAGAVLGWTGNISANMQANTYNGIPIDDDSLGWIGGYATLGATAACLIIGKFCDVVGRKLGMLLLTFPFILGWLLIIFAKNLPMLYVGRFLTGMAGFAFGVSCPIYSTEIADKDIRGALGSFFELFLVVGVLFAYVVATVVDMFVYTIIIGLIPIVFFVVFVFQPETPVFLMKGNKEEAARKSLQYLRGQSVNIEVELQDIKTSLAEEHNKITFLESIKKRATKMSILICFMVMFLQKAGGICVVEIFTDYIFTASKTNIDPNLATIVIGVVQVISTFISSVTVDKLGRRILLISSTVVMALSTAALGVYFSLSDRKLVDEKTLLSLNWLPITSVALIIISFSLGIGTICWMLSAELFPPEIKSSATGFAAAVNWFTGFLTTKFYMDLKNAIGTDSTFYIFAVVSILGTVFICFVVPETKGKSLEQIQRELNGGEVKKEPPTDWSVSYTCNGESRQNVIKINNDFDIF